MGGRESGKKEALGHFTLSQVHLSPSSLSQTLPAGACSQARVTALARVTDCVVLGPDALLSQWSTPPGPLHPGKHFGNQ